MEGSVLLLGGGVAGMRAAAELLQQEIRVHLVERATSLGGVMAGLDRLFPTGEHVACARAPLSLALAESPDLSILLNTGILSLEGAAGDFNVTVSAGVEGSGGSPRQETLRAGAIIVATGFAEERGETLIRLGHGRLPGILTGLEFARLLGEADLPDRSTASPGGKELRRVAWIVPGVSSPVPFMAAAAQALDLIKRRPGAEATLLCRQRMSRDRECAAFRREAESQGVRFAGASSSDVSQAGGGDLLVSWSDEAGGGSSLAVEMVVVSVPMIPRPDTGKLARILGLEMDGGRFLRGGPEPGHPVLTSREGIYQCGAVTGPRGIGESVIQACAAASRVAGLLAPARGRALRRKEAGKPIPVTPREEPRIAVLFDLEETEGAGILPLEELAEHTRGLPGVAGLRVSRSSAAGSEIREMLGSGEFNRLLVAGPSPITHEIPFQRHAEAAGLNRFLVEMVNLRDQCARVHAGQGAEAVLKAKALLSMGVARARRLEPLESPRQEVVQRCLVVGAGPAGVACATSLARMGIRVDLVESAPDPGRIPGNDHPFVAPLLNALLSDENVSLHSPARVGGAGGSLGRFRIEVVRECEREAVEAGAIVLTDPSSIAGPAGSPGFVESLHLERDDQGLFAGTQGILNPLDFTTEGIFNCGAARGQVDIEQAVVEGEGAASRAACILSSPVMLRPPVISSVVDARCDGCAYCIEPCPTRSITLLEFVHEDQVKKVVEVDERTCIGCGVCMATCPKEGIDLKHFRLETFSATVKAALELPVSEETDKPLIVCFCCNRCAYPGADAAGIAGLQYPASVRIIRSVCAGTIHPSLITNALTEGADGVLLLGCHPGECRSREGIRRAQARAESLALLLEDFGLEEERFRMESVAASEGRKFATIITEMTAQLEDLGPSPYRREG